MQISLESVSEDGNIFQKFLDGINDASTKVHYIAHLKMFTEEIPNQIYHELLGSYNRSIF